MTSIIFSAYFGFRPERIAFMSRVAKELPSDVTPVLFNLSGEVVSELAVMNAEAGLAPFNSDPIGEFLDFIDAEMPELRAQMLSHIEGEFEINRRSIAEPVANMMKRVRAFLQALEIYQPAYVFLWNQFNVFHKVMAELLRRRGIRYGYFHDGLLPGSIAFDFDGEMGNSWIAREPDKFAAIEVSDADVARADNFIQGLRGDEINQRHVQIDGIDVAGALRIKRLDRRPVLFFAGQNDWHAGVKPLTSETAHHSPNFAGSAEGLAVLDRLAGEIGFSIVYKPHPLCRERDLFLRNSEFPNSLVLKTVSLQGCMDVSAIVSTIASQTCYAAILQGKPVMMFGRNQITGKGLTYDVFDLSGLADTMETALADPLAATRRVDLARHVAQLERSYLFEYGTIENGYFRRGAAAVARMLQDVTRLPAAELQNMQAAGAWLE